MKLLCYWDKWCWLARAKKLALIKKRPASLRLNLLGSVSWEHKESEIQRESKLYLVLQLCLFMSKSHPGGTCFEGMKGLWKAAEAGHCGNPGKAIGEGAACCSWWPRTEMKSDSSPRNHQLSIVPRVEMGPPEPLQFIPECWVAWYPVCLA